MQSKTKCDHHIAYSFLREELNENDAMEFESHLDECESCQRHLTDVAGKPELWAEARDFLKAGMELSPSGNDNSDRTSIPEIVSFLNPTENPRMMGRFGEYEIAGIIGQGGMGVVLKGLDESLNRYVAIKALAPQLATNGSARNRFAREAQAAAAVVHDNVVAIHGVSECRGIPYLIMPYVRGESLQKLINRNGPLSPIEIIRVSHQVACGLAAAHAQGLVHRDIKPANILMPLGVQRVLITDFGLARAVDDSNLTGTGAITGTPEYMSPEQALGQAVDARSDLFSLGTMMYTMCTGHSPFRANNSFGVLRRIVDDAPRPIREINPSIPEWLQRIVEKLHAKQPAKRFRDASELASVLKQCLAHLQTSKAPLPAELSVGRNAFSYRKWVIATLAVISIFASTIVWGNWKSNSEKNQMNEGESWNSLLQDVMESDAADLDRIEKRIAAVEMPTHKNLSPAGVLRGQWELQTIQTSNKKWDRGDLIGSLSSIHDGETDERQSKFGPFVGDLEIHGNQLLLIDLADRDKRSDFSFEIEQNGKQSEHLVLQQKGLEQKIRGCADYNVSEGLAQQLNLAINTNGKIPKHTKELTPDQFLLTYRRIETDPIFLQNRIDQIKSLVVHHYKHNNRKDYPLCNHLLDLVESYQAEAELRQQIRDLESPRDGKQEAELSRVENRSRLKQQYLAQALRESNKRALLEREWQDKQRSRQRIEVLVDQITELQKESNYKEAEACKVELLSILQENDKDYEKANRLRHQMSQLRLKGKHNEADRLAEQIDELEQALKLRYSAVNQRQERRKFFEEACRLHAQWQKQMDRGESESAAKHKTQLDQLKQDFKEKFGAEALSQLEQDLDSIANSIEKSKRRLEK